jgi:hypothetical protein
METLHQILQDNNIISEESKEKVCIIEDIVKLTSLVGYNKPTWDEFCMFYDMPLNDLQNYQQFVLKEVEHRLYMEQMRNSFEH